MARESDREVFDSLLALKDTSREVSFITYAIFAQERSEWIRHFEAQNGTTPTQADIDRWIANLTDYQFAGMRDRAVNMFDEAARLYLRDEMDLAEERALHSAIVSEVKAASVWWKQLAIALAMSIVAPLLLGVILAAGYYYSLIPSPADVARKIEARPATSSP